jgi:hypothetical protein
VDVQVDRKGYSNRIVVALQNLPAGVSAERVILGLDPLVMDRMQTRGRVPVKVDPNAAPGKYTVLVDARNEAPPIRSLADEPGRFVLKVQ